MAHGHGFATRSMRVTIELQIDEERSGGPAVLNQVAHQDINQVGVDFHSYSNRCYSIRCPDLYSRC